MINKIIKFLKNKNGFTRTDTLNHIINIEKPVDYLEIGVRDPNDNFNNISIKNKDGVDPCWKENPKNGNKFDMESDIFFKSLDENKKYDLIFIDGLHIYEQALRDINNAIKHLSLKGTILIHDCNPATKWHQRSEKEYNKNPGAWNGTTWKAFVELRCTNKNIYMTTINTDHGLGLIKFGKQNLYTNAPLKTCTTWKYFKENRSELLNLISVKQFIKEFPSN